MTSFKRLVLYLFPIYLIFVEYGLRFSLGDGRASGARLSLSGSTSSVTAVGLSLIASTLIPKTVTFDPAAQQLIQATGVTALRPGDGSLIGSAFVALLILPFAWGWALYMIHDNITSYDIDLWRFTLPGPFWVAVAIYFVGITFSETKERI